MGKWAGYFLALKQLCYTLNRLYTGEKKHSSTDVADILAKSIKLIKANDEAN